MRPLNLIERNLINRFAEKLTGGSRAQLIDDLTKAAVESATDDGSRVMFEISGYERPPYKGQHAFEVEGRLVDADGTDITVSLYADEIDQLYELELVRWDPWKIIDPDWKTLTLY